MAANLYFARDSKLFVEMDFKLWEVPILDGFSFSQTTNSSDITLAEMQNADGISRRGRRLFTDSLAPAEWSFSTYVRPYYNSTDTEHHAVEEVLWALMAGADTYGTSAEAGAMLTITESDSASDRTNGTYTFDDSDFTTSGQGVGGILQVVIASNAVDSVNILASGSAYDASDTITIAAAKVGGTGDLVITVASVEDDISTAFKRTTNPDSQSPFGTTVAQGDTFSQNINFGQSNRSVLATCNLYFVMETNTTNPMVYKLEGAAINEASIDFDVDGIATINWSGFASNILDMQSKGWVDSIATTSATPSLADVFGDATLTKFGQLVYNRSEDGRLYLLVPGDPAAGTPVSSSVAAGSATTATAVRAAITKAVDSTATFIRNRLTQLLVDNNSTTNGLNSTYSMTITGGNVTISNNITYLVPEELGKVNVPIEHVTGGRTVSGSYTCYLTFDTANSNAGTSSDFYNDLTAAGVGLDLVVNDFRVEFQIGGNVTNTPRLYLTIPKCHIEVPSHSIEDVISVETNFGAYTTDFDKADEFRLVYFGDETSPVT